MILERTLFCKSGIFGELRLDDRTLICYTLEHAFKLTEEWKPKLPMGVYRCVRGVHQLIHGGPLETFEVTNVPGHIGILFHQGNYNNDSDGCILLGETIANKRVILSAQAFNTFMGAVHGVDSFSLTVT